MIFGVCNGENTNYMKSKYNESTHNRPEGDRLVDAPIVIADIPTYIKQLKNEIAWDKNDKNSITLFKSQKMRVVLVAMHKKATMHTEKPEHLMNIQVIKGRVRLEANGNLYEAEKNQIIAIHEKMPYLVKALSKSIFLLTVVN